LIFREFTEKKRDHRWYESHICHLGTLSSLLFPLVQTVPIKIPRRLLEGKPDGKPDIEINIADDTFVDLATGKANGT
jgi:hypothetical protein